MTSDESGTQAPCLVAVNEEGQYSIWPRHRALPHGWHDSGSHGTEAQCLAWIETTWTDMRPLSARNT